MMAHLVNYFLAIAHDFIAISLFLSSVDVVSNISIKDSGKIMASKHQWLSCR